MQLIRSIPTFSPNGSHGDQPIQKITSTELTLLVALLVAHLDPSSVWLRNPRLHHEMKPWLFPYRFLVVAWGHRFIPGLQNDGADLCPFTARAYEPIMPWVCVKTSMFCSPGKKEHMGVGHKKRTTTKAKVQPLGSPASDRFHEKRDTGLKRPRVGDPTQGKKEPGSPVSPCHECRFEGEPKGGFNRAPETKETIGPFNTFPILQRGWGCSSERFSLMCVNAAFKPAACGFGGSKGKRTPHPFCGSRFCGQEPCLGWFLVGN